MRLTWILVLLLILRNIEALQRTLQSPYNSEMSIAGAEALSSVLSSSSRRQCAIYLVTDGVVDDIQIYRDKLYRHAPWGMGVFKVADEGSGTNKTSGQFSLLIAQIRKLRKLSRCVNIVVLSDDLAFLTSFAKRSLEGRLLVWATRLLLVTRLPLQELWNLLASSWTFSMMNSLVIVVEKTLSGPRSGVYIYLPYSLSGNNVVRLASWTPRRGFATLTSIPFFYDKFSNFYGAAMNVTAKDYKPYWFEMKEVLPDGSVSKRLNGMDYLLLEAVAKALNFSINLLPIANWAEALDRVVSKESFITPVIHAVLRQRLERFDYTIPYTYASYSLSMKMPQLTPKWQSLYYPLADTVWIAILGVTALMTAVMFVMNKVGDFSTPPRKLELGTVLLEVSGTLFGQNLYRTLPTASPSRVLVATWLIFAFIVGTAYRGNLTAALTLPKYPQRPETLREVVQTVKKVTIEPWGKDYKAYFAASDSEVFMKLADLMELGPALLDGLQEASIKNTAHMDSRAVLELNIAESFTRGDGTSSLYVVRESAIPGMAAWPIPHDSPFKKNLDRCIRASLEAGLYDKWENDMLELARKESRERQRRTSENQGEDETEGEDSEGLLKPLTVIHMQGPLILLLLGLLFGTLIFLIELVVSSEGCTKNERDTD